MSRKLMRPLMRQQSRPAAHELYWIELWRGGGGLSFSIFLSPPPIRPPEILPKNTMIKDILTRTKSTTSQPTSQPAEDPSEDLLKRKPATFQQIAETTAKQVGYQPGDEVTGVVLPKQVPNPRLLFISVPDWSEPALCSVQNAADWRPTERIRCVYVKADAQGRLVFENRDGIRRNRWKR